MLPKSEGYNDPTQAAYWYQGMQSTHEKGHAFAAKIEDSNPVSLATTGTFFVWDIM